MMSLMLASSCRRFQSTPSARRATSLVSDRLTPVSYFNPRPPRGGRRGSSPAMDGPLVFQSTPSARRATEHQLLGEEPVEISIHALREEGDTLRRCGSSLASRFQSTPSARRATLTCCSSSSSSVISIHALREEGDKLPTATLPVCTDFNPRPPRGGRLLLLIWIDGI